MHELCDAALEILLMARRRVELRVLVEMSKRDRSEDENEQDQHRESRKGEVKAPDKLAAPAVHREREDVKSHPVSVLKVRSCLRDESEDGADGIHRVHDVDDGLEGVTHSHEEARINTQGHSRDAIRTT